MGSNSATLKSEIERNLDFFHISLHVLYCHIGIKSSTAKSEIRNCEIGNSYFRKERPRVPLHVLYYYMRIKSAIPKLEIRNPEIRNSNFRRERPLVPLHVH